MCAATGLLKVFALYIPELVPLPFKIFQWLSTIYTLEKVQLEPISFDFMEGRIFYTEICLNMDEMV